MRRSSALVGDTACITGRAARLLAEFVNRHHAGGLSTMDPEVREAVLALSAAGRKRPDLPAFVRTEAPSGGRTETEGELLTASEVGSVLDLSAHRVRQLRTAGLLVPVSTRRPMKFDRKAVAELAEERRQEPCSTVI